MLSMLGIDYFKVMILEGCPDKGLHDSDPVGVPQLDLGCTEGSTARMDSIKGYAVRSEPTKGSAARSRST